MIYSRSNPTEFEERPGAVPFRALGRGPRGAVGEKETSEQAEIVRRYYDLFSRDQLEALRDAEDGRVRRRARAALPAAQDLRGRARGGELCRPGRRAREPAAGRARAPSGARRCRSETRRRNWRCWRPTATVRSSARIQADASAAGSTPTGSMLIAAGEELVGRTVRDRRRGRTERRGEGDLAPRALGGAQGCERRRDGVVSGLRDALVREAARPRARAKFRRASTRRTCAGSRRSSRPTRRSARPRSASRR